MQPSSPSPAPPPITPGGQKPGQYDFLFQEPPKKSRFGLNITGTKQRILVVAGGAVVLLILIIMAFSFLGSGNKANQALLLSVAQKQTELIRIADLGAQKAHSTTAKNLAVTTAASLTTDQNALLGVMSPKPKAKELALGKNSNTDKLLSTAEQNNQFDEVFVTELQKELLSYQKLLKQARDSTSSKKTKAILSDEYTHASVLAGAKEE
jgi:hypothetical protein